MGKRLNWNGEVIMAQSEAVNMSSWQSLGWEITSLNVPSLVIEVAPPAPYDDIREWRPFEGLDHFNLNDEAREDAEDLEDANATELRYRSEGVKGFIQYRDE
jgi:hypothetical protein